MHATVCVLDTGAGANNIRAHALDPNWLDTIYQRDMPETQCASDTKLDVFSSIILHAGMGE